MRLVFAPAGVRLCVCRQGGQRAAHAEVLYDNAPIVTKKLKDAF
jgi:hypothetical protein